MRLLDYVGCIFLMFVFIGLFGVCVLAWDLFVWLDLG